MGQAAMDLPIGHLLSRVAQVSSNRFGLALDELGIRPRHYAVLVHIDAQPATNQQRMATALGVTPSVMVTLIDELESHGAVARRRDPANRRQSSIELTPAGLQLLGEARRISDRVDEQLWHEIEQRDRVAAHRALATLYTSVTAS
jgi:DNA-binding MarR family transcriptional regulator